MHIPLSIYSSFYLFLFLFIPLSIYYSFLYLLLLFLYLLLLFLYLLLLFLYLLLLFLFMMLILLFFFKKFENGLSSIPNQQTLLLRTHSILSQTHANKLSTTTQNYVSHDADPGRHC